MNDLNTSMKLREKEAAAALLWATAAIAAVPPPPAIQSSQFGNRVNLIWLALGIQNATNISVPFILAKLSRLMLLTYMGIVAGVGIFCGIGPLAYKDYIFSLPSEKR